MKVRIPHEVVKEGIRNHLISWDYLGEIDSIHTFSCIFKVDEVCYSINFTSNEGEIIFLDEFSTVVESVGLLAIKMAEEETTNDFSDVKIMKDLKAFQDIEKTFIIGLEEETPCNLHKFAFYHEGERVLVYELLENDNPDLNRVLIGELSSFENRVPYDYDFYREHADEIKNGTGVYSYEDGELIKM